MQVSNWWRTLSYYRCLFYCIPKSRNLKHPKLWHANPIIYRVTSVQAAMVKYGVEKGDIFQTNDLFERKDLGAVTNTIFALDRAVIFEFINNKKFWESFMSSVKGNLNKPQYWSLTGRTTSRVDRSKASGWGGGASKRLFQPVKILKPVKILQPVNLIQPVKILQPINLIQPVNI